IGSFVARVSKGRTIREYVLGILIVPPVLSCLWIAELCGTARCADLFYSTNIGGSVLADQSAAQFTMIGQISMTRITSMIAIIHIFTFLVTSADSATFLVAGMTSGNTENPSTRLKVLWGLLLGFLTISLILAGGLNSLQAASLLAGLPFTLILILMIFAVS